MVLRLARVLPLPVRGRIDYLRQLIPVLKPVAAWHRRRGRAVVACLGDSHLAPMWLVQSRRLLPRTRLAVLAIGAATAYGSQNPSSSTHAYLRWRPLLRRLDRRTLTVCVLGEVDVGNWIFTRDDPEAALRASIARYQRFLDTEVLERGAHALVLGLFPPVIDDYATWEARHELGRDVEASWHDRARFGEVFNEAMASWCATRAATFVDLAARVTDADGRVRQELLVPGGQDHHLSPDRAATIFADILRAAGCR